MTGGIMLYAKNEIPAGFLLCNGQEVSRATYAGLFAIIGTKYGEGDGSTTFNVPDLAGKVLLGLQSSTITIADISSLVSWWKMDGNSQDSKSTNHGTDTNITYSRANGSNGKGADFNGSTSKITVADHASLDITGSITIEALINPDTLPAYGTILCKGRNANGSSITNYCLRLAAANSGKLDFYYHDGTGYHVWTTSRKVIEAGKWQHIIVKFTFGTGGSIKCFVNKASIPGAWAAGNGNAAVPANNDKLSIGAITVDGTIAELFDGKIDEIRIYNALISDSDCGKLYEEMFAKLGNTGGARTFDASHTHTQTGHVHNTVSGSTGGPSAVINRSTSYQIYVSSAGHTHTITAGSVGSSSDNGMTTNGSATASNLIYSTTLYPLIKT